MFQRKRTLGGVDLLSSGLPGLHEKPGLAIASRDLIRAEPLPLWPALRALEFRGSWKNAVDAVLIPTVLFFVAVLVRAPGIAKPPSIVFDEVHFVGFMLSYLTGQFHFDIHPHLGKMVFAVVGYLVGFRVDPTAPLNHASRNLVFKDSTYIYLRLTSLIFGSAQIPLMYLLVRSLNATRLVAMVGAVMPLLDNMLIIESRYILLNTQLMTWTVAAFFCAVNLWSTPKHTRERLVWLVATAITGTSAALTKFTAGVGPFVIAVVSITGMYPLTSMSSRRTGSKGVSGRLSPVECILAGAIAAFLYVACFALHLHLMPRTGEGEGFMRDEYKAGLLGSSYYNPKATLPGFFETFFYLHYAMITRSAAISNPHPWGSHWYEWIANSRGLLYHRNRSRNGSSDYGWVYLLVNPFVSCLVVLVVVVFFLLCLARLGLFVLVASKFTKPTNTKSASGADKAPIDYFKRYLAIGCCFASAYLLNLAPYLEVKRPAFNYHYMPSVFYGEVLAAISIDSLPKWRQRWAMSAFVLVGTVAAYWYWSPWIYGTILPPAAHVGRQWLPRWD